MNDDDNQIKVIKLLLRK